VNRRLLQKRLRRVCLLVMLLSGLYVYQRFEGAVVPGVGGGPLQRVLVDRWATPDSQGERLLYGDRAGLLTQGWLIRVEGSELILAPAPFIDPPQVGQRVHRGRILGGVILVLGAAKVPLRSHGME